MVEGVGMWYSHTPEWSNHKSENNYNCRGSPQGARGPSHSIRLPSLCFLHQEDKPPECLALRPVGLVLGEPEGRGK